jgi:prepilin-type N-terminal cleavage/methylation domain-containing protein
LLNDYIFVIINHKVQTGAAINIKKFYANYLMITKQKGFTLIELLIVIAVIAITAGVVYVALNPSIRFQDTRDSRRYSDMKNVEQAIQLYIIANGHAPYLQDHCGPDNPSVSCYTNDWPNTGSPYTWNDLGADLAPFMPVIPRDPCGTACNDLYTYNYYAPGAYMAAGDVNAEDAKMMYSIYASKLETDGKSFGVGWNQFHSY